MPVERKIIGRNGKSSATDGAYFPKNSLEAEPYFKIIDGDLHFETQPWMRSVIFDASQFESNPSFLENMYIMYPDPKSDEMKMGDKIEFKFTVSLFNNQVIHFGHWQESEPEILSDVIAIGSDFDEQINGRFYTEYLYTVYDWNLPAINQWGEYYTSITLEKLSPSYVPNSETESQQAQYRWDVRSIMNTGEDIYNVFTPD